MSSDQDQKDVLMVASGDKDALGALYDRHAGIAMAVAFRILRNEREAEDIVQDAFVEAWRRAATYEPQRSSVRSWILLLVRSRALDRRKSAGFQRSVPLDLAPELADDNLANRSDERNVSGLLAELTPQQRQVLEMGYFEGLSSSEIAERLKIPVGTVKSRVASAMARLRQVMVHEGEVA